MSVNFFCPLPKQDVVPPLSNLNSKTTGICFGTNSSILRLDIPDNPSKPCLSCTKQWCLNQNLPICAGATLGDTDPDTATGKEGDVEARCFRMYILGWWTTQGYSVQAMLTMASAERDSPRDQLVVTLFLLTVFGLLLGAGIKGRMVKAGLDTSLPWHTGRKWWQVGAPSFLSTEPTVTCLSIASLRHGYQVGSTILTLV